MLDQSINDKSIAFAISGKERFKYPTEFILNDDAVISDCIQFFKNDTPFPLLSKKSVFNKDIYEINDVTSDVLLRRLNLTIKTINGVRQENRSKIIKAIKVLLKERKPYSILRLDVKKFYESIDIEYLVNKICSDSAYSLSTQNLLNKWHLCFQASSIDGVPRGLSISSTLSEYFMRPFDKNVKNLDGVFYFARFVDDIIICTTHSPEDTYDKVEKLLPKGLVFGEKKSKKQLLNVASFDKKLLGEKVCFEYLGYKFTVSDEKDNRNVLIDLSDTKKNKLITRIIRAFLSYNDSSNFRLLEKRIRFLTSNFYLFNRYRSTTVRSGIFFNYPYITESSISTSNLYQLDDFLRNIIYSNKVATKTLGTSHTLSIAQKKSLSKLSFVKGHNNKIFHRFTPWQMTKIKRCWSF